MKVIDRKTIKHIRRYMARKNILWLEGLDAAYVWMIKYNFKLTPKYYWPEGDSYIFHRYRSPIYYCVTKPYWDALEK